MKRRTTDVQIARKLRDDAPLTKAERMRAAFALDPKPGRPKTPPLRASRIRVQLADLANRIYDGDISAASLPITLRAGELDRAKGNRSLADRIAGKAFGVSEKTIFNARRITRMIEDEARALGELDPPFLDWPKRRR